MVANWNNTCFVLVSSIEIDDAAFDLNLPGSTPTRR